MNARSVVICRTAADNMEHHLPVLGTPGHESMPPSPPTLSGVSQAMVPRPLIAMWRFLALGSWALSAKMENTFFRDSRFWNLSVQETCVVSKKCIDLGSAQSHTYSKPNPSL